MEHLTEVLQKFADIHHLSLSETEGLWELIKGGQMDECKDNSLAEHLLDFLLNECCKNHTNELPLLPLEEREHRRAMAEFYAKMEERPHTLRDMEGRSFHTNLCRPLQNLSDD